MDWSTHYPAYVVEGPTPTGDGTTPGVPRIDRPVEIADIGCGFGGLLFALAPRLPETLILGLEIRVSVTEFVENKIKAVRKQQAVEAAAAVAGAVATSGGDTQPETSPASQLQPPAPTEPGVQDDDDGDARPAPAAHADGQAGAAVAGGYGNISVLRANAMKFLPNFFPRAGLRAIFLCFPDPHFKSRKHKARITSATLNSEYAYALRAGGKVYTITDVEDLHAWMVGKFDGHPSFERVGPAECAADELVGVMTTETEEGRKVERNGGTKYVAVWRRLADPSWPGEEG